MQHIFPAQLGPQQLKYIISLSGSSDCFRFRVLCLQYFFFDSIVEDVDEEDFPTCVDSGIMLLISTCW